MTYSVRHKREMRNAVSGLVKDTTAAAINFDRKIEGRRSDGPSKPPSIMHVRLKRLAEELAAVAEIKKGRPLFENRCVAVRQLIS